MFFSRCAPKPRSSRLRAMPKASVSTFLLIASLLLSPATTAQDPADDGDVIKVSTDLLLFPIRIKDKKGLAVAGLTTNDLKLNDNDQVTSGITFTPGADRVALMFALDQSGSL